MFAVGIAGLGLFACSLQPTPALPAAPLQCDLGWKQLLDAAALQCLCRPCPLPSILQRDLGGPVKADDCFWTLDEGELQVQLTKAEEGATWASAIAGAGKQGLYVSEVQVSGTGNSSCANQALQPADQKRLLLERFQEEVR